MLTNFPRARMIHGFTQQLPLEQRGRPVDPFKIRQEYCKNNKFSKLDHKNKLLDYKVAVTRQTYQNSMPTK